MQTACRDATKAAIAAALPPRAVSVEVVPSPANGVPNKWRINFTCAVCDARDRVEKKVTKLSTNSSLASTLAAAIVIKHGQCGQCEKSTHAAPDLQTTVEDMQKVMEAASTSHSTEKRQLEKQAPSPSPCPPPSHFLSLAAGERHEEAKGS
jgi:hypothetical protein